MIEFQLIENNLYYNILQHFGEKAGGIYIVIWKRDGQVKKINRLVGPDLEGILYIGKADFFLERVINLKKSVCMSGTHGFGLTLKQLKKNILTHDLPKDNELYVCLIQSDNPKGTEELELRNYQEKFGELPPFNAQF
jgi:hypothetical protein